MLSTPPLTPVLEPRMEFPLRDVLDPPHLQKHTPVLEPRMGVCLWRFLYSFPRTTDDPELRETKGATGCDLVIYEVAPVRTRIPHAIPRTTDGFQTSRNQGCDPVLLRNLRGRESHTLFPELPTDSGLRGTKVPPGATS